MERDIHGYEADDSDAWRITDPEFDVLPVGERYKPTRAKELYQSALKRLRTQRWVRRIAGTIAVATFVPLAMSGAEGNDRDENAGTGENVDAVVFAIATGLTIGASGRVRKEKQQAAENVQSIILTFHDNGIEAPEWAQNGTIPPTVWEPGSES